MSLLNAGQRDAYRITQVVVVRTPAGDERIEQFAKSGRSPSDRVNSIGDRANLIRGEHTARDLTMAHGNAVHVSGEAKRQIGHIERVAFPGFGFVEQGDMIAREDLDR